PPQGRLGVDDQVLVADLEIVVELRRRVARLLDLPLPALADVGGVEVADGAVEHRQPDVVAVADDVDEPRLTERRLDLPHPADVARGLPPPTRLPLALRVGLVEGAQGLTRRQGPPPLAEPGEHLLVAEPEVLPLAAGLHSRQHVLRLPAPAPAGFDDVGD